jgi:hypothetical protein
MERDAGKPFFYLVSPAKPQAAQETQVLWQLSDLDVHMS